MKFKIQMTQDETDHGPFSCNREGGVPTLLEGKNFKLMTGIISQGSTEGESKQATPTPFQKPVKATFLRSADPFLSDVLDQLVFLAVLAEPTLVSCFVLAIKS